MSNPPAPMMNPSAPMMNSNMNPALQNKMVIDYEQVDRAPIIDAPNLNNNHQNPRFGSDYHGKELQVTKTACSWKMSCFWFISITLMFVIVFVVILSVIDSGNATNADGDLCIDRIEYSRNYWPNKCRSWMDKDCNYDANESCGPRGSSTCDIDCQCSGRQVCSYLGYCTEKIINSWG